EGDMRGPWNSDDNFDYASDPEQFTAVDGGDGSASVDLSPAEARLLEALAVRTASDPAANPVTGLELGKDEATMARTPKVKLSADGVGEGGGRKRSGARGGGLDPPPHARAPAQARRRALRKVQRSR